MSIPYRKISMLFPTIMIALFAANAIVANGDSRSTTTPEILGVSPLATSVGLYQKFEAALSVTAKFNNPYDPTDIQIDVTFIGPSGQATVVPAFYYRDFTYALSATNEQITPTANWSWRVRFAPNEVGAWTYSVVVTSGGNTAKPVKSGPFQFTVTSSSDHGFLRISNQDSRYLMFDDKTPFFSISENMAWYDNGKMADYQKWLNNFSAVGGNAIRVWMSSWGFDLEWNDTGLGNYNGRQDRAYELDRLFDMAAAKNVYVMLTLMSHGEFSTVYDPEWDNNPFNSANGGPLTAPEQFATNKTAIRFWQQKLRYIAARWGYSTHLMAWEWWNEVEETPISTSNLVTWMTQSAAYLKTVDPYAHLITNSSPSVTTTTAWALPTISITQAHIYSDSNWALEMASLTGQFTTTYNKPFVAGEFGYNTLGEAKADPEGVRLHLGLWAPAMTGSFGTGQFWWWDGYINDMNLYYQFKPIAAFFANENLAGQGFQKTRATLKPSATANVYGLQSHNDVLLWIVSNHYTDADYQRYKKAAPANTNPLNITFPDVTGLNLVIPGLDSGRYTIELWDTHTGTVLKRDIGTAPKGVLQIALPTFQTDLAIKVIHP